MVDVEEALRKGFGEETGEAEQRREEVYNHEREMQRQQARAAKNNAEMTAAAVAGPEAEAAVMAKQQIGSKVTGVVNSGRRILDTTKNALKNTTNATKAGVLSASIAAYGITQIGGVQFIMLFGFFAHFYDFIVASNDTFFVTAQTIQVDIVLMMMALLLNVFHRGSSWGDWAKRIAIIVVVFWLEVQGFGLIASRLGGIDASFWNPAYKGWWPLWWLGGAFMMGGEELFKPKEHIWARGVFFFWAFLWVILLLGTVSGAVNQLGWTNTVYNPYGAAQNEAAAEKLGPMKTFGVWLGCMFDQPGRVNQCMADKTRTPEDIEQDLQYWIDSNLNSKFIGNLEPEPNVNIGETEVIMEADLMGVDNNLRDDIHATVTCGTVEEQSIGSPRPTTLTFDKGYHAIEQVSCSLTGLKSSDTTGQLKITFEDLEVTSAVPALFWSEEHKSDAFENFRKDTNKLEYATIVRNHENDQKYRAIKTLNEVFERVPQTQSYLPDNFKGYYQDSLVVSSATNDFIIVVVSFGGEAIQGYDSKPPEGVDEAGLYLRSPLKIGILNNVANYYSGSLQHGLIAEVNAAESYVYFPNFIQPVFAGDNCQVLSSDNTDANTYPGKTGYSLNPEHEGLKGLSALKYQEQKPLGTCRLKISDATVFGSDQEKVIYDAVQAKVSFDYNKIAYTALRLSDSPIYNPGLCGDIQNKCSKKGINAAPIIQWLLEPDLTTELLMQLVRTLAVDENTYYGFGENTPIGKSFVDREGKSWDWVDIVMKVATHEGTSSLMGIGDCGYSIPPMNVFVCAHQECLNKNNRESDTNLCMGQKCRGHTVLDRKECAIEAGIRYLWLLLSDEVANDKPESKKDMIATCDLEWDTPLERALRRYNGVEPDCSSIPQKCYTHIVLGNGETC